MKDINEQYDPPKEDFDSGKVFEYLWAIKGDFQRAQEERRLAEIAQAVKFKDFKKIWKAYQNEHTPQKGTVRAERGLTEFDGQPFELDIGDWRADDYNGIFRFGRNGDLEVACPHPIMPVARLRNIDTGELKAVIKYGRGGPRCKLLRELAVPFSTISSAKEIVKLSSIGVSVTSGKRAQNLVDFMADAMDINYELIPEYKSTSRMGWNDEGFSPYVDDVKFDGADNFGRMFAAISTHGDREVWMREALEARTYSTTARILLAATFGSVLVEPLGCLPFFIHLWGMDSGTGKTVGMMLAAAAWADPSVGGAYLQTFKSTSVGIELTAGFLNSLPLFLDELQLSKDSKGRVMFNVYELAAGRGKTRATKELGLASTASWANCFITSGETPIVSDTDGAGAVNRVIEIECRAAELVITDGHRTANNVKANYGYAGKEFVEHLQEPGSMDRAKSLYSDNYDKCVKMDTTSKQAMAAAILVTADQLATDWIFKDGRALTITDISEFLKTRSAVSAAERGYATICGWVAQNADKLRGASDIGETYGKFGENEDVGYVCIINTVFEKVCVENSISSRALLSHLKSNGLLHVRRDGRGYLKAVRLGAMAPMCVVIRLPENDENEEIGENELPF